MRLHAGRRVGIICALRLSVYAEHEPAGLALDRMITTIRRSLMRQRHHARRMRGLRIRWQRRMLFVVGGGAVGTVAAALAVLADRAQSVFLHMLEFSHGLGFGITPLGFAMCAFAANRYFPNTQGSGIPQAIAAHRTADASFRQALLSWRIAVGKVLLTLFGLLCGASAGREGPTVQIGASIMYSLGRLTSSAQRGLIVAGSAAGVAAAFNTPLAGIMFGIEELSRSFERRSSALIVLGVVAAGFTAVALLGNYTYFGSSSARLQGSHAWLAVALCGIAGGGLGGLFSRLVIASAAGIPGRLQPLLRGRPVMTAALCGLGVALCGALSDGSTYGTGYQQVRLALDGTQPLPVAFGGLKFIATLLTSMSTIPGGIFSPSLAIGAGLGANLAGWFSDIDPSALLLLGMVAYLAGVVQAPITAFVIVDEMTANHAMLIPLMAAALIGNGASRLVCREGIYHALAQRLIEKRKQAGVL